jgi:hypothetical protein
MTEEATNAVAAEKKGIKDGKKRAREESDPEVVEVEMPDRKKSAFANRGLDLHWKKWVMERLDVAEARSERIEDAIGKIGQTLESVCGLLRRAEGEVPDESEQGSDEEAEQTLRDVGDGSEKAEEKSEKKPEEDGDVEMVE